MEVRVVCWHVHGDLHGCCVLRSGSLCLGNKQLSCQAQLSSGAAAFLHEVGEGSDSVAALQQCAEELGRIKHAHQQQQCYSTCEPEVLQVQVNAATPTRTCNPTPCMHSHVPLPQMLCLLLHGVLCSLTWWPQAVRMTRRTSGG